MLESFTNTEKPLNIRNISAESPEQKPDTHFDVKRDIGQADWDAMFRRLQIYSSTQDWGTFLGLASTIVRLDKARLPEVKVTKEILDTIAMVAQGSRVRITADLMVLGKADELKHLNWTTVTEKLEEDRRMKRWSSFFETIRSVAELDPSRIPNLTEEEWKSVVPYFVGIHDRAFAYTSLAIGVSIVDSGRLPQLTDEDWFDMKEQLGMYSRKKNDPEWQLPMYALDLKVLSEAEQKRWEEKHRQFGEESAPLPEVRNF